MHNILLDFIKKRKQVYNLITNLLVKLLDLKRKVIIYQIIVSSFHKLNVKIIKTLCRMFHLKH